ncbi:MAG: alanine--glyoxylate aminotransferase family protein [Thermoanaerobaculia bacterium]
MTESHEEIRYFLPGPTWVMQDVREAMAAPAIGHRSPEFKELYQSVSRRLPEVVRTSKEVMVVTASGSLIWDMAVVSTVRRDVLNLTNGAFSERFHTASKAWGRDADQVSAPMGHPVDPELVRQALRRKRYEAVTVAHNETSTGVLNPLEDIVRAIREESDALILVDAVSSLGGARIETEDWGIDLLFASSQKALALPPGIAVVSLSDRLRERAEAIEHRGFYTDLLRLWKKHCTGFTLTTPAIPQIRALDRQLERMLAEGMEKRWQRHLELRRMTEEWAADRGFTYASVAGGASPTVSCLKPPVGVDAPSLVGRLKEEGFIVGGGYGPWKPTTFRIAHMGEVRLEDLRRLLAKIDELVES